MLTLEEEDFLVSYQRKSLHGFRELIRYSQLLDKIDKPAGSDILEANDFLRRET